MASTSTTEAATTTVDTTSSATTCAFKTASSTTTNRLVGARRCWSFLNLRPGSVLCALYFGELGYVTYLACG